MLFNYPSKVLERYFKNKFNHNYKLILSEIYLYEDPDTEQFIKDNIFSLSFLKYTFFSQNKYKNPTHIQFGFKDDITIDAYAERYNNLDFIIINFGLLFKIYDLCMKIFMTRDAFQEIGSIEKEKLTLKDIPVFFICDISGYDGAYYLPHGDIGYYLTELFPHCSIRHHFAISVYYMIIYYIFFHELGHHENGHIFYLEKNFSISMCSENFNEDSLKNNILTKKILEYDADKFSIKSILNIQKDNLGLNGYFQGYSKYDKLRITAIAINIIQRIFDYQFPSNHKILTTSHPAPAIRSDPLYIESILKNYDNENIKSSFLDIYKNEYQSISNIWKEIGILQNTYNIDEKLKLKEISLLSNGINGLNLTSFKENRNKILKRRRKRYQG